MKKIVSVFVLAGVMTLTACGNSNNEQVTESTSVTTVAETTTATETTVKTETITTIKAEKTTIIETEDTSVVWMNYNKDYVKTVEAMFYSLENNDSDGPYVYVNFYADDMNNDGVKEIICCKIQSAMGFTDMHILDVVANKITTIEFGQAYNDVVKYVDTDGTLLFENSSMFTAGD